MSSCTCPQLASNASPNDFFGRPACLYHGDRTLGDGGIDGLGVYRMSLVSFPVFFQCKRYAGSVGASAVRDFRGAMTGRGDKGLLITTGTFTTDAKSKQHATAPHH